MSQLVVFTWTRPVDSKPITLILDASVNESHAAAAMISKHRVEKGSNITDHIEPLGFRLSIEGFVTNDPIVGDALIAAPGDNPAVTVANMARTELIPKINGPGESGAFEPITFNVQAFSSEFNRVKSTYPQLFDAINAGALFTITTAVAQHDNMAAASLVIPRNVDNNRNSLRFTMDFEQIRIVNTQTTTIAVPAKKVKSDQGVKAPAPATDQQANMLRSVGRALVVQ